MYMNAPDSSWGLPDPASQPDFYRDMPMKRFLAFVVDTVVILIITVLLVPLTAFTALFYFGFLGFLVAVVYRSVTIANRSATPGMRLMGIELRSQQGERLSSGLAFAYTLVFSFAFSMVIPQVISIILILTTPRAQGLQDFLLGTAMINRPSTA